LPSLALVYTTPKQGNQGRPEKPERPEKQMLED